MLQGSKEQVLTVQTLGLRARPLVQPKGMQIAADVTSKVRYLRAQAEMLRRGG